MTAVQAQVPSKISLKNILYATDFSATSEAALPFVIGLARKYGAHVHALHVRPVDPYWPMALEAASAMAATEQELAQRDADHLHELLAGVPHDVTVARVDIWAPLSEMITRHEIDLVVVGTHGRSGVAKVVMGSVAAEIIRSVPCPVLTIGPDVEIALDHPLEFKRILFATNLGPASLDAVPYAIELANDHHAQLIVMMVLEKESPGEFASQNFYTEFETRRLREIFLGEGEFKIAPKFLVETGDAARQIVKVARDLDVDLVILGTKRAETSLTVATHFSKTTVQRVIAGAPSPVLTVPHIDCDTST
jgi:nucleotide-binding universal stress UspA family protein